MKLFGLTISRAPKQKELQGVTSSAFSTLGWTNIFSAGVEFITGGWQMNATSSAPQNIVGFSAVQSGITLIGGDCSKLRWRLMRQRAPGGILTEAFETADALPWRIPLDKPNHYQTRSQFVNEWVTCKLIYGNTYVLLERDNRSIVKAMYILNPTRVEVLVSSETREVFYRLRRDNLAGINDDEGLIVPASEVIHDREFCPWHPLQGVPLIFACSLSALQGIAIQQNSQKFFANMSRPSGMLTAPTEIPATVAQRLKETFEAGFSGDNIGRLFVAGSGLKYDPLSIPAQTSQLIEQLGFTIADVGRVLHIPPYKLGLATSVPFANVQQMNQDYYSQCLQRYLFDIQDLLREGLRLPSELRVWFDLDDLFIMDPLTRSDADQKDLSAGIQAPNEARAKRNLPPVTGGDQPFMQQQMWQVGQLANRTAPTDVPALPAPTKDVAAEVREQLALFKASDDEFSVTREFCDKLTARLLKEAA